MTLGTVEEREELELSLPFDRRFQVAVGADGSRFASYFDRANAWRSIETDWLFASADFALQLDNLTNNTSLALAFEIGEGGPVRRLTEHRHLIGFCLSDKQHQRHPGIPGWPEAFAFPGRRANQELAICARSEQVQGAAFKC